MLNLRKIDKLTSNFYFRYHYVTYSDLFKGTYRCRSYHRSGRGGTAEIKIRKGGDGQRRSERTDGADGCSIRAW